MCKIFHPCILSTFGISNAGKWILNFFSVEQLIQQSLKIYLFMITIADHKRLVSYILCTGKRFLKETDISITHEIKNKFSFILDTLNSSEKRYFLRQKMAG